MLYYKIERLPTKEEHVFSSPILFEMPRTLYCERVQMVHMAPYMYHVMHVYINTRNDRFVSHPCLYQYPILK
jgi:hypothetical protein